MSATNAKPASPRPRPPNQTVATPATPTTRPVQSRRPKMPPAIHRASSRNGPGGTSMRIVITGASGNVGTALLRVLPAEHDVLGVVRRAPGAAGRLPAGQLVLGRPDWTGWGR